MKHGRNRDDELLAAGCLTLAGGTLLAMLALLALYGLDCLLAVLLVRLIQTLPVQSVPTWQQLAGELFVGEVIVLLAWGLFATESRTRRSEQNEEKGGGR